jgi:hypothetical protein
MMDDIDDYESNHSPRQEVRHGVRHLTRDVVTLVELQSQLLKVDLRNWLKNSLVPGVVLLAVSSLIALASLPLLLLSLAYYLARATELSLAASLLIVGGGGVLVALLTALAGWLAVRRGRGAFERFRVELEQNVAWLKQVLGSPIETAEQLEPAGAYKPR